MLTATVLVIIGLLLLTWSADLLVDNASILSLKLGVSTFLVGVIVIGFGTSAPELFVSAMAAIDDKGNLALGNALGSNITNIGLVLGSAAIISVIKVNKRITHAEMPALFATGIIAVAVLLDGHLSRLDGILLFALLLAFLVWSARHPQTDSEPELSNQSKENSDAPDIDQPHLAITIGWTVLSIALLLAASRMLVIGATDIAQHFGVSDLVIGLTIVAIGTSLPELAAAVSAARKNTHDMIVGNIIGSNVFNTLGVLGVAGSLRATDIDTTIIWRDFPVMFALTIIMWLAACSGHQFNRRKGIILLLAYLSYVCYLAYATLS